MSKLPIKLDLKAFGKSAGQVGAAIGGFSLGHLAYNKLVPASLKTGVKSLIATLGMFVLAGIIASNSTNQYVTGAAIGFGAYGGVKAINQVAGITPEVAGFSGLGFSLPEPIRKVAGQLFPNLGEVGFVPTNDIQIFGPGEHIEAIDASYEILGLKSALELPDLSGNANIEVAGINGGLAAAYQNAA